MNETHTFGGVKLENKCLCCLKTDFNLSPMSVGHEDIYRKFVDTDTNDTERCICILCHNMLNKINKFIKQCQMAQYTLQEQLNINKSLNPYDDYKLQSVIQITYNPNIYENSLNDNNYIKNEINDKKDHCNGIKFENNGITNNEDRNSDSNVINDICDNNYDVSYDEDMTNDRVLLSNSDDEEIPLNLLTKTKNGKETQSKKSKKKSKSKGTSKCKKDLSDLPPGFSSRMVRETNEYTVIKLTKEQVLQELADKALSESYLRSPFKCEKCVKGFNFEDVLNNHMDKHSTMNGSYVCEMCTQRCRTAVSLRGHIKSHTTRYKCKVCGEVRLSRQHLLEHYCISHTGQAPVYTCDTCHYTSTKRTAMQRHVRSHWALRRACHACGKQFTDIHALRVHTLRHDKSSKLRCSVCDNTFIYQSVLRRHMEAVHRNNDYYCVECDQRFRSQESLKLHFKKAKVHRDGNSRNTTDTSCSACVNNSCKKHTKDKFKCSHCDESFNRKSSLKQHLLIHNVSNTSQSEQVKLSTE